MGKYSRPEVEYISDEGFVKLNLRRPVNFYVPTELADTYEPSAKSKKPSANLELEWVYGYRGRDGRSNLFPLASGEIVYYAAAVAIIYNPETKAQRHFTAHTDDIKCIAVHPDGKIVATGQIKGKEENLPHVNIWDSESLESLHAIGSDTFNRGVSCVAFSRDGVLLAAVDDSPEPKLSIWQWADETKLGIAKASAASIFSVAFTFESPARIITIGKSHLGFWMLTDEGELRKKSGVFGDFDKPKFVTSVLCLESGELITGDSNGNLFIWEEGGNTVKHSVIRAHKGSVFSLTMSTDGNVISAGRDLKIVEYTKELEPTGETSQMTDEFGAPRVVFKLGDDLIIGTMKNCILKTPFEFEPTVVTQGHLEELWGLAVNRSDPHFITAGQDKKVYYRDASTHDIIWSKELDFACQSADVSLNNLMTIVSGSAGKWIAIENESQEILHEGAEGEEIIQVTRFSPDGTKLALGSRDNKVYIYGFEEDAKLFTRRGECEGHSSFITHLDWSKDGEMLRTNSGDYEVLYWAAEDCSLISQSEDYKDVEWATNNCILAFNSIGIWPPGTDGTHINSCNKGNEKSFMVTGDDFGMVKFFMYPAYVQNAKHKAYHGHSSHITNVVFLSDDSYVLSTGGRDTTAMQWKVVLPDEGEEEAEEDSEEEV